VQIALESQVVNVEPGEKRVQFLSPEYGNAQVTADAVIMACGAREKNVTEKGWITGSRPAQVFFTRQILELLAVQDRLPIHKPVVMGSDILAYAAVAKLLAHGSEKPIMMDPPKRPRCPFYKRLYFMLSGRPRYVGNHQGGVEIVGRDTVTGVRVSSTQTISCDGVVISGELVPNSELALTADLDVDLATRKPVVSRDFQMSKPGWVSAGNIIGGEHGAEWCYFHGRRVARSVAKYLSGLRSQ